MLSRRDCLRAVSLFLPSARLCFAAADSFPTTIASRVVRAFRTPGPQPNGLQATRDGLWVLDQRTNRASLVRFSDGEMIREFETESDRGSGIAYDGSALWIASTYNRLLLKVDPQTGRTLRKFPTPGAGVVKWGASGAHPVATGAHGLEFQRGELWVAVPPSATIYVLAPESGSVRRSFAAPGVRPHGLGWDPDGSLWCAESNYRAFFKLSPRSGRILKQAMLPLAGPEVDGRVVVPHGMTVWENSIWFCSAETAEVYRLPIPA